MKQKYVMPTIEIVGTLLENSILVGSNGGGSGGQGTEPENPVNPGESGGGQKYPGENDSKEHNFNAWESWDEY